MTERRALSEIYIDPFYGKLQLHYHIKAKKYWQKPIFAYFLGI